MKNPAIKKLWPLVAIGSVLSIGSLAGPTAPPKSMIDDVLRTAVEDGRIPGVVAVVTNPQGPIYQAAFGARSDHPASPMTVDAIFRIASMTKPVTSVAAMQLVELGKIQLDVPAASYLPELGKILVLDHIDSRTGRVVTRPPAGPVTVRELLSHTSGFGYPLWDSELRYYRKKELAKTMVSSVSPEDLQEPLLFDPGTKWEYGTSTTWLGKLIEHVSGQSLEEFCQQHIFDKIAMVDTSFNVAPEKQGRLVTMHQRRPDGTLTELSPQRLRAVKSYDGGAGLYSTAGDYAIFMRMLLNGGQLGHVRILRPETIAMMCANQIGDLALHEFKTSNAAQSVDGQLPGGLSKFGLGFALTTKAIEGGRAAGSMEWAGLDNTYFWIDPTNKIAAVLMMQMLPFLDNAPVKVLKDFEHAVYSRATTH